MTSDWEYSSPTYKREPMAKKKSKKNKEPKEEKKARKKEKKAKKFSKKVALYADLDATARKAITEVDRAEMLYNDAKDKMQVALENLRAALPKPTFEHPERGPMSVMKRGDVIWWRKAPDGK